MSSEHFMEVNGKQIQFMMTPTSSGDYKVDAPGLPEPLSAIDIREAREVIRAELASPRSSDIP